MMAPTELVLSIWILSGVVGLVIRLSLLAKYSLDLRASKKKRRSEAFQSISKRAMESAVLHIAVKVCVIAIGVQAWILNSGAAAPTPITAAVIGLSAIPWLMTIDGLREYFHQQDLLHVASS